ncbi:3562_t:CDS:10 [Entrophospora sp. SA101]|nr:3562_t:CDS:10 [Entrophospora sp. SA101]
MENILFLSSNNNAKDVELTDDPVVVVTGGNTGIGYVTCRELARKNAHVFVLSRSIERGTAAVEKIKQETKNQKVEFLQLDLQSLKSVKECAESFLARKLPLHVLINNAGIMATKFSLTVDGIQDQFGTNHVGHFYLTKLLLPTIEASAPSRIVNVSSIGHKLAKNGIEFDKINDPNAHSPIERYGVSKLSNILFTVELNKRLEGKQVYANSLHPGSIHTELFRGIIDNWGRWVVPFLNLVNYALLTPDDGALTTLYCATSPEIEEKNFHGKYFIPFGVESLPGDNGKDEELAKKLWQFTDDLVAVVTGGNTGIGYVTCRELARKNAHVFVLSRSIERGTAAVEKIKQETGNQNYLTKLLLPTIEASAPSRIVNVSSMAHKHAPKGEIEFDKINDPDAQAPIERYRVSKLSNILFTVELNKRLEGKQVYANSLHPGVINTELSSGIIDNWGIWVVPLVKLLSFVLLTPDDGALTSLYCATSPEIEEKNLHGKFFVPFGVESPPNDNGKDEELAKKLWKFTDDLVVVVTGDNTGIGYITCRELARKNPHVFLPSRSIEKGVTAAVEKIKRETGNQNVDFLHPQIECYEVVVVTGGNTGIGYVTCRELARKNAHVFVLSRSIERGTAAVEKIKQETGNQNVELLQLDLQSLKSVKECAQSFLARKLPLHILINNAGIMATKFSLTVDGIQDQFGTNHVGHFYLTKLLLPTIEASAPSRIVNVSSMAHKYAPKNGIEFDKINDPNAQATMVRYGTSKLSNILFTVELNKRLEGKQVYANSLHPGIIKTELSRGAIDNWGKLAIPFVKLLSLASLTPNDGALTSLYCATSPEIEEKNLRGKYFIPFGVESSPTNNGKDEELAKKLWQFTDDLVNEKLKDIK